MKRCLDVVPKLRYSMAKGDAGRIVVVGGSELYTGAPYFAGMAALRTGADLATIVCSEEAAIAIKCYSPDLMTCPYLRSELWLKRSGENPETVIQGILERTSSLLARSHALLIGPGLSRDTLMLRAAKAIVNEARRLEMPIVLDGDALTLVAESPECVANYKLAFLTPNANELLKLSSKILQKKPDLENSAQRLKTLTELSERLGNVYLVSKSHTDLIVCGEHHVEVEHEESSPRRCGGQGDIFAGCVVTFINWARRYNASEPHSDVCYNSTTARYMESICSASLLSRKASWLAYKKHGRAMLASDALPELGMSFEWLNALATN